MIVNLALFARFTSIYLYYSVEACFFDHPVQCNMLCITVMFSASYFVN